MYNYIIGKITEIDFDSITVENNKIGYRIVVANPYLYKKDDEYKIYLFQHIKEDEHVLFGFKSKEEKEIFLKLISVKGLGSKMVMPILASSTPGEIIDAIENENIAYIKQFPKIGDKLAKQIILDLKGKLNINVNNTTNGLNNNEELSEILKKLGYKEQEFKWVNNTMKENIIRNVEIKDDGFLDNSVRPEVLSEYIGQEDVKENIKIFIEAAKIRNEVLDHVLLYGPPGLGKTTLAYIIANEMGTNIKTVNGPSIEKAGDLAAILSSLEEGDILFIDEIHRIPKFIEEILYPAMEDFSLDIIVGKEGNNRSIKIDLVPFTLVGATTRIGNLTSPLRDRFGIVSKLQFYTEKELKEIIKRTARVLKIAIEEDSAVELAKRSRGTPRIANRLLKRVRDFAQVIGDGNITKEVTQYALEKLKVDKIGLDDVDRELLLTIIKKFNGGPVGIEAISSSIGEEVSTIEDVYEPYLLQKGLLKRTNRGRIVTELGYNAVEIEYIKK